MMADVPHRFLPVFPKAMIDGSRPMDIEEVPIKTRNQVPYSIFTGGVNFAGGRLICAPRMLLLVTIFVRGWSGAP